MMPFRFDSSIEGKKTEKQLLPDLIKTKVAGEMTPQIIAMSTYYLFGCTISCQPQRHTSYFIFTGKYTRLHEFMTHTINTSI